MYDTLSDGRMYFVVVLWIQVLIRSAIVGFGQSHGFAQVIALTIVDCALCISEHSP